MAVSSGVLLMVVALAALWDLTLRRIPNGLVVLGWLLGLGFFPGISYLGKSLLPVVILYLPWGLGWIGAGDLKLLAVVCGYLSVEFWFDFFLIFVVSAAGMSVLWRVLYSNLWISCSEKIRCVFLKGEFISAGVRRRPERVEIPLSVAMLAGVCRVLL